MRDTPDTPDDVRPDKAANRPLYDQQAQPTTARQAGNEGDPSLSREIPETETGEQRWAGAETGAGADVIAGGMTTAGEPGSIEEGWQATSASQPPRGVWGSEDTVIGRATGAGAPNLTPDVASAAPEGVGTERYDEPATSTPNEAYGQGETREFTPLGAEPGIEQQEVLQSQQYKAEERHSDQGFLGTIGEKLRSLFGNAPRPPRDDMGEDAGEAHP